MNAKNLGFPDGVFDLAICGFMGWYECFDFEQFQFSKPDQKTPEIFRVLRSGGRFVCCSWEAQEDVTWMENEVLRHYPAMLENPDYLAERPVGMSYEKAEGYELIFRNAGFKDIEITSHSMTFVSTDEEEWWRQMRGLGWEDILDKIEESTQQRLKEAIFNDLQRFRRSEGICFNKSVFLITGHKG